MPEILPDCRPKEQHRSVFMKGMYLEADILRELWGGWGLVPEENCTFAFYPLHFLLREMGRTSGNLRSSRGSVLGQGPRGSDGEIWAVA